MSTATATVGTSFHTPNNSIINTHSTQDTHLLSKLNFPKTLSHTPLVVFHQHYGSSSEPISIPSIFYKWRAPRMAAMVADEESIETAAETVNEEKEEEDNGEGTAQGSENESETDEISTKLYFGNLPYHCDSAQLAGIVQQYANPELVEVLYDRNTGRSRGFAFVTMSSMEDCNAVIDNLDGSEYGGRYLRVNFSDRPRKREPLFPETEYKLFVGNLSWSATSESLYEAFQAYGNIVGARVLYDGESGKSRGYGFVCYATKSEMENALVSLNGMELEGRAMRVSLAEGKKL